MLDTRRDAVVATVDVGANPTGVAVDPAAHRAYVTLYGNNSVAVLDTGM